jgi:hypothetical protein
MITSVLSEMIFTVSSNYQAKVTGSAMLLIPMYFNTRDFIWLANGYPLHGRSTNIAAQGGDG